MSKSKPEPVGPTRDGSSPAAFSPSWADRLASWEARLPGPSWAYYLAIGLILFTLQTALFWAEGAYPVGTLLPAHGAHALLAAIASWFLILLDYLDQKAELALATLRPVLTCSEEEYGGLLYRLTTLPARPALLAGLAGAAFVVLITETLGRPASFADLSGSPLSAAVIYGSYILTWWIAGTFLYHTIHQLRAISFIYTNHTRVDLFRMQPLYAFSGVTAISAASISGSTYLWGAVNPGMLSDPTALVVLLPLTALGLGSFVWPLLGIHRLLLQEKGRLQDQAALRFGALLHQLHQRVDSGRLEGMDDLNKAIASLEVEQQALSRIPTWPWQPETMRLLVTALALPLGLWIVQYIIQRLLGG